MELSPEQIYTLDKFKEGANIFLTGPGGSGKTELIRQMVTISNETKKKIQVCALTGCAAVLLACKAKTIHSFAGIGLANGSIDEIVKKVITSRYKTKNWTNIDILIIDEVSMMSKKIFDCLDLIGKKSRKNDKPFGGIQLVFSGDFYQLPPIGSVGQEDSDFCFESLNWKSCFHHTIILKKIFRQSDENYTNILNLIRIGKLEKSDKSNYDLLIKQVNKPFPTNFKPTILLSRRKDVDSINITEYSKLEGESKKYIIEKIIVPLPKSNKITFSEEQIDNECKYLMTNIMGEKEIELKIGTQVMCIANIDMDSNEQIVNGSQGVILKFINDLPLVQFNNGIKRVIGHHVWSSELISNLGVKQIPLIYAWAITIHKSQGLSLEVAQIDAGSSIFECGQTYVALSRVKSLEGLYLTDLNLKKIKVNKKVKQFYEGYEQNL
jgi:ATP-dependent DNA helicase PIF1